MTLRFKKTALAVAVLVLAAAFTGYHLTRSQTPDQSASPPSKATQTTARPALTVTTVQAVASRLPVKVEANGSIAAWQEASVGTESNALRRADGLVNVGDAGHRGQVLARVADGSAQADVAQQELARTRQRVEAEA